MKKTAFIFTITLFLLVFNIRPVSANTICGQSCSGTWTCAGASSRQDGWMWCGQDRVAWKGNSSCFWQENNGRQAPECTVSPTPVPPSCNASKEISRGSCFDPNTGQTLSCGSGKQRVTYECGNTGLVDCDAGACVCQPGDPQYLGDSGCSTADSCGRGTIVYNYKNNCSAWQVTDTCVSRPCASCSRCSDTQRQKRANWQEYDYTCDTSDIAGSVNYTNDTSCCVDNRDCSAANQCNTSAPSTDVNNYHVCQARPKFKFYYCYPACWAGGQSGCIDTAKDYLDEASCNAAISGFPGVSGKCYSASQKASCDAICRPTPIPTAIPTATPVPCVNTPPSNPNLSPGAGNTVTPPSATLSWLVSNWGNNCAGNNNSYSIYADTSSNPSTLIYQGQSSSTSFSGVTGQRYYWRAVASNGSQSSSSFGWFTFAQLPWFQIDGGGVTAEGSVRSQVPPGETFIKNVPGVAAANQTVDLNGQPVSASSNWQSANSNLDTGKDYYTEITNRMIFGVTPNTFIGSFNGIPNADGYIYYKSTGAIDLSGQDFGSSKVVLIVEGNVNIKGNITFAFGGQFILLAKGNITIDPTVSNVQGIYLTQQVLSTGTGNQLRLDGSFIGMAGVQLQRTGGSPSELFVFHPEYLTSLPKYMLRKNVIWSEVAP